MLYDKACRILAEIGLFRLVCIGELDRDSGLVRPVAVFGEGADYLQEPTSVIPVAGGPLSMGTVGTALRTGTYQICNDVVADPRMSPWHEIALKRGFLATASFPLSLRGRVIGGILLHAGEVAYFQDDEIALLTNVAGTLSFALEASERELERRHAEEHSAQLAAIVESSEDAIIGEDLNGIIMSWNIGAERNYGYSALEMLGTSITRLIPLDRRQEATHIQERLRRGDSVKNLETVRQTKDGRLIDVSVTVSPIKAKSGEVVGVSKVVRDITQAKKAEARFRRLVDSNIQGVFFWNTRGEIVDGNDAFLDLTRYSREDLQAGRINWVAITPPEYADRDRQALAELARTGVCSSFEKEFVRKDGSRVAILIGAAMFEDKPKKWRASAIWPVAWRTTSIIF
jgi:PAS domain S-box-containing protein